MHEVLVNGLGGLSLPRKSVVRLTDRPDMALDVWRGRKTRIQQQQESLSLSLSLWYIVTSLSLSLSLSGTLPHYHKKLKVNVCTFWSDISFSVLPLFHWI